MSSFLKLKKSNCKNCYKCIRNCPVKSIRFSGNQANIVDDECILCGQCFVVCPQNAKEIIDDVPRLKIMLGEEAPVIASVAPSFTANFGVNFATMKEALLKLGFAGAEETAIGATIVKKEYERIVAEKEKKVIITSCCHSVNLLVQKHFPALIPLLAPVVSPMQAHCIDIKERQPNAKTVFIGPCLSKKDEGAHYGDIVDCVLTFEELSHFMESEGVAFEAIPDTMERGRARIFPTTGGIIKSMHIPNDSGYTFLSIDGVENCVNALKEIETGSLENCFIEMSACVGSCIGGPVMHHTSELKAFAAVSAYSGKNDFATNELSSAKIAKSYLYISTNKKMPSEREIQSILLQMGKTKPQDELNCSSCGYNTCREKAIAVYQGKADLSMCLPFLKEKAENFSYNIIKNTLNGILVLNEDLEVQEINTAAREIMNIRNASDVLGGPLIRILDPKPFLDVLDSGRSLQEHKAYLAEYKKYVEETIVYDKEYRLIICIMRDVTNEEQIRLKKENISRDTIDIADKVVEKQMRVVQEIASLLGETAAETKIALTKLKESIKNE